MMNIWTLHIDLTVIDRDYFLFYSLTSIHSYHERTGNPRNVMQYDLLLYLQTCGYQLGK